MLRSSRIGHSLRLHLVIAGSWVAAVAGLASPAGAQTAANVLIVINSSSVASREIGEYYARRRNVPGEHIVQVTTSTSDVVTRAEFETKIEAPIGEAIVRRGLQDQILFLVLTKGIPLRVGGTAGLNGTTASVDSELTLLYRKLVGETVPVLGRVENPLFAGSGPVDALPPFSRQDSDLYLVTRLDGFTIEDVFGLIDRGISPAPEGRIVLDQRSTGNDVGDRWLLEAAERLERVAPGRAALESTRAVASHADPVIGYFSWGANDPANRDSAVGMRFVPGAIAGRYASNDAWTFTEPATSIVAGAARGADRPLAGDLVRQGVTGLSAQVAEPLFDASIRPQILFPAYLQGLTLAETFYRAIPYLSWQTIVIGDPLCTPFPRRAPAISVSPQVDRATGLPALFAERRLSVLTSGGLNRDAVALGLKADAVRGGPGGMAEAEPLLVKATALEPRLVAAHLLLAHFYEETSRFAEAAARYRHVVALQPKNAVALNNLAFLLATRMDAAREALPLAERALAFSNDAVIADTVGWIHHLLGDDRAALRWIEQAVAGAPANVDVLVHAAIVNAAIGNATRARAHLAAAEKLEPGIRERPEVKELLTRIGS